MHHKVIIYGLIIICLRFMASLGHEYCSTDEEPYRLFGEKTFYDLVGGKLPNRTERAPSYCTPIHISIMVRHGARYPFPMQVFPAYYSLANLTQLINSTGTAQQCKADVEALKNWKIWLSPRYDVGNITETGAEEMKGVAERYRKLFPEILDSSIPANRFWFSSTQRPQTIQSLLPFQRAILQDPSDLMKTQARMNQSTVVIPPIRDDPIYTNNCKKYARDVYYNKEIISEFQAFKRGPVFRRIARSVSRRLGLPENAVDSGMLWRMYRKGCIYQQWVEERNGPWCFAFTKEELEAMDFADDLQNYARKSNRIPLLYEKNCFASKEIINSLISSRAADISGEDYFTGRFRIVHTSNVVSTAASFGLYKVDVPLNSHNFETQRNRTFRFSYMIPTAGHVAFVLYRCGQQSNYQVQVYWNERIVKIPGCPTSVGNEAMGLCSLDEVVNNIYTQFVPGAPTECDHGNICKV